MYVRKKLDINWLDLVFGISHCLVIGKDDATLQERLEGYWGAKYFGLTALSVRSSFDALLTALQLPPSSEVLMSAITIPDMVRIIEHHGLVPVPIDISIESLTIDVVDLKRALTSQTRAILFAHLFGTQIDLTSIAQFAKENHLLLFEDCAQAYSGTAYLGHPQSDVVMFSFGLIKTATALGGALLRFRDESLHSQVKDVLVTYPKQKNMEFLKQIIKSMFFKGLSLRLPYQILYLGCCLIGTDHDQFVRKLTRSYKSHELFFRIRHQPSTAMLSLLARRLKWYQVAQIDQRIESAQKVLKHLSHCRIPGIMIKKHSYWLFPIWSRDPIQLSQKLWRVGFDATQGGSSLVVVHPPSHLIALPNVSTDLLDHILFLPVNPTISEDKIQQMCQIVTDFENEANV